MDTDSIAILGDSAIYTILFVGIVLCVFRPFVAFLLGVAIPICVNGQTLTFSRLSGLGPYFNLYDLCLGICAIGVARECMANRRPFKVPHNSILLIGVLTIGASNAMLSYGYAYEVLRALRWAATAPIMYALTANMVTTPHRARWLFVVAFLGAIAAEAQHVFDVVTRFDSMVGHEKELRMIAFGGAHVESWLVAGPYVIAGKIRRPWVQIVAAILFLVGIVMGQTRSVAISAACAAAIYYAWLLPGHLAERLRRLRSVLTILTLGLLVAIPQLGFDGFTESYSNRMEDLANSDESTLSRRISVEVELDDWLSGNIVIGQGLAYFHLPEFARSGKDDIAYGHVGYVTYLSQLGIIGFIVYAIWFPLSTLALAYSVLRREDLDATTRHLAAFAGSVYLYYVFVSALSGCFLGNDVLPGVLGGVLVAFRPKKHTSSTDPLPLGIPSAAQ